MTGEPQQILHYLVDLEADSSSGMEGAHPCSVTDDNEVGSSALIGDETRTAA
jgi:hypothetical protein